LFANWCSTVETRWLIEDGNRASDNERPLYKNDLHKPRSSCQKKKEFVLSEWERSAARPMRRANVVILSPARARTRPHVFRPPRAAHFFTAALASPGRALFRIPYFEFGLPSGRSAAGLGSFANSSHVVKSQFVLIF
jgi:hypothetical protein